LRYGHGPEILRDVSFHIEAGGFNFLTGPSGAGKTSLLRLLFLAACRIENGFVGTQALALPQILGDPAVIPTPGAAASVGQVQRQGLFL
jgi:ABC-type ATPase involved in cell division